MDPRIRIRIHPKMSWIRNNDKMVVLGLHVKGAYNKDPELWVEKPFAEKPGKKDRKKDLMSVITGLGITFRYAPGRKEMDKEKGKRKLQENSKRKEQRKFTTRWKPIFWTQELARMAVG
jgi:hypothetical protein